MVQIMKQTDLPAEQCLQFTLSQLFGVWTKLLLLLLWSAQKTLHFCCILFANFCFFSFSLASFVCLTCKKQYSFSSFSFFVPTPVHTIQFSTRSHCCCTTKKSSAAKSVKSGRTKGRKRGKKRGKADKSGWRGNPLTESFIYYVY